MKNKYTVSDKVRKFWKSNSKYERNIEIFREYENKECSYEDLADKWGLSRQRVEKIVNKVKQKEGAYRDL